MASEESRYDKHVFFETEKIKAKHNNYQLAFNHKTGVTVMKKFSIIIVVLAFLLNFACGQQHERSDEDDQSGNTKKAAESLIVTGKLELDFSRYKVTFIELGADRCIPCRAMQPVYPSESYVKCF